MRAGIVASARATPSGGGTPFSFTDDFTTVRPEYVNPIYDTVTGGKARFNGTDGGNLTHPGPATWAEMEVGIEGNTQVYRAWHLSIGGYEVRYANSNAGTYHGLFRAGVAVGGIIPPEVSLAADYRARIRVENGLVQAALWPVADTFPGWAVAWADPSPLPPAGFGIGGSGSGTTRRPVFLAPLTVTGES